MLYYACLQRVLKLFVCNVHCVNYTQCVFFKIFFSYIFSMYSVVTTTTGRLLNEYGFKNNINVVVRVVQYDRKFY